MPRAATVEVSRSVLKSMFRKFNIWSRIRAGELRSNIVNSRPSTAWPDGTSHIIKHFTADGKHIATTHRIEDCAGKVVHWDAKDFRLKDICYWRG